MRTAAGCSRLPRSGRASRPRCWAKSRRRTLRSPGGAGFRIFHAVIADASGSIRCTWMNQAFLADILKPHLQVVVFGDVKLDSTGLHFMNPEYELVSEDLSGSRPLASCRSTRRRGTVTPNMQRRIVRQALDQLPADLVGAVARRVARPARSRAAACGGRGVALSAERGVSRSTECVSYAAAAAADLRRVLSVPVGPRLAAARKQRRVETVGARPSTTGFDSRPPACCRSS